MREEGKVSDAKIFDLIIDNEGDSPPTLRVATGYLHRFRGYRYQVSGTYDGQGDHGSSSSSLVDDEKIESSFEKPYLGLLTVGHIAQSSINGGNFFNELLARQDVFNEFVEASWKYGGIFTRSEFNIGDLIDLFKEGKPAGTYTETSFISVGRSLPFATVGFNQDFVYLNVQGLVHHLPVPSKIDMSSNYALYAVWSSLFFLLAAMCGLKQNNYILLNGVAVEGVLDKTDSMSSSFRIIYDLMWDQTKHLDTKSMGLF